MNLIIENRQRKLKFNQGRLLALSQYFADSAMRSSGISAKPEYTTVTIILTGDAGIRKIHRAAMGINGNTDVITLPYAPGPGTPPEAELVVNTALAVRIGGGNEGPQGYPNGLPWSPAHELGLYIAHGFDHLAGYGDLDDDGCRLMRQRELAWLREADSAGLLRNIFTAQEVKHV